MKLKYLKSAFAGSASVFLLAGAAFAHEFNIPSGDLANALDAYSAQTGIELLYAAGAVRGSHTRGAVGDLTADAALSHILAGTGYTTRRTASGAIGVIHDAPAEPSLRLAQAQTAPASSGVETVLVTAQKKVEDIQMVPIAVTALSSEQLQAMKIEGGPDLLKTIPNVTFSKNNFTGYNFSIRGVGTKAISATTDPGVAVAFNSTSLIQNRLFEQEYFDVERVEILRGPQGTLYGRNATSGVINVISAKPDLAEFSGSIKGEVGNYQSRRGVGIVNIPLIEDMLAIRLAGSYTMRDGYGFNSITGKHTDGRNLWSTRVTLGFKPTEQLHGNLIWEHFNENDDRSRTGKQLCHRDDGPQVIGSTPTTGDGGSFDSVMRPAMFSTGCKAGSLYDDSAFGTPNGIALPFVFGILALGDDCGGECSPLYPLGINSSGRVKTIIDVKDPYGGMEQSHDLRTIASFRDPKYRAKADVYELNFDYDVTPSLTFTSQTAYDRDQVYSFQDYNRFNTVPIFNDTAQLYDQISYNQHQQDPSNPLNPSAWADLAPGGLFCDPQLGCSRSIAGFDISQGKSLQFSQEFRLQSNYDGPINFSLGANFTKFHTVIDYYVMYNLISALARMPVFNFQSDPTRCLATFVDGVGLNENDTPPYFDINTPGAICPYTDPNPVESINGEGHNYFRSENPYRLGSWAGFGEAYWQASDSLKVTAGLRYTDDRKTFTPIPSQILLAPAFGGGVVNKGYPAEPDIKQHWGKFTGRLAVDWVPKLDFTDQTMLYASYAHGYKGGGANPPSIGFDKRSLGELFGIPNAPPPYDKPILYLTAVNYGPTFKPEYVNAFEVGAKNTLLNGTMVLNADAFFYDYKDYQVSKIVDRTAVNENFDAHIWGTELESVWQPMHDLRLNANFGYLGTSIGSGAKSIDLMNRTQSNPDWVVVKPWAQLPSNCIVPRAVVENYLQKSSFIQYYWEMCGGWQVVGNGPDDWFTDPNTGAVYTPDTYPEINGGAGFNADLKGKQLPNSPHFTFNIGAEYTLHLIDGWDTRVRGDFYHQSASFARVYNDKPYDRLRGWNNANLSLTVQRLDDGLAIEIYAKNIMNATPITDAFLNSDDSALTTNIFVLDPRLIGFSITKPF